MRLVVVVKGYPRLSETFIAQELRALELRGWDLVVVSLRAATDKAIHPIHREIEAPVVYLPEYLRDAPARVFKALRRAIALPGFARAMGVFWRDLRRDCNRNRVRRFGQALVLATEVVKDDDALYAHFLHTPASVARYAALMLDRPFGISAHAKDIWTTPAWEKREKLEDAAWAVTCTAGNMAHLNALIQAPTPPVHLVYHGLKLQAWPAQLTVTVPSEREPVRLLCVARAVPKKGLDTLLDALALLPDALDWRLTHIGGGTETAVLQAKAADLGIAERVAWLGAQPADAVHRAYRDADLFVLASRIAADGDRDGLPNVLMEAMAAGVAVIATEVAAIPELVQNGTNGRLVPTDAPAVLAQAIADLATDRKARERLAQAGRATVVERFAMDGGIDRLDALMREALGLPAAVRAA